MNQIVTKELYEHLHKELAATFPDADVMLSIDMNDENHVCVMCVVVDIGQPDFLRAVRYLPYKEIEYTRGNKRALVLRDYNICVNAILKEMGRI